MGKIIVDIPTGPDWEHSLDGETWQLSAEFYTDADGTQLVEGKEYTVYSRNVTDDIEVKETIIFGSEDSRDTLHDVSKRGGLKKGWTNILLHLMGGLFLDNIPYTTEDYPALLRGPDGRVYQYGQPTQEPLGLLIVSKYEERLLPVEFIPSKAAMNTNTCTNISGWVSSSTQYPAVARIVCDGLTVGYQTATTEQTDVQAHLNSIGGNTTKLIFGFNWLKPAAFMDGIEHTWQIFVGDTEIEATDYNVPKTKTCGVPVNPEPTVQFVKQSVINSVVKGTEIKTVTLIEVLSDLTERAYTGELIPVWSVAGSPAGIILNPDNNTKSVAVRAGESATVDSFQLQCTLTLPQTVQVITVGCTRPPSGLTTYKLAWRVIPVNGYPQLFSTLDDANQAAGRVFDGTLAGTLDLFFCQVANLNVGTEVFLRNDITTCEKVSDNIYYVTSHTGTNTVLKAIQVVGGVIVAVKDSTYSSAPSGPNRPPVKNFNTIFLTAIEDGSFSYERPVTQFTDPDFDPLTWYMQYSADGGTTFGAMPGWASFDVNTRVFSGTNVPVLPNGVLHQFRIGVTDGRGGDAHDDFPLLVAFINYAQASTGTAATASSTYDLAGTNYAPITLLDGKFRPLQDGSPAWGQGGGWNSAGSVPQHVLVTFNKVRTLECVVVTTLSDFYQDPADSSMTFTLYGATAFRIQVPDGAGGWRTVSTVTGNNQIRRVVTFPAETTSSFRVMIDAAADNQYARLTEIEAYRLPV